jgi:hypothetical protein
MNDTVEIWKSVGNPEDAASFTKLTTLDSFGYAYAYNDEIQPLTGARFYHYRLAILKNGVRNFGAVLSTYYEP